MSQEYVVVVEQQPAPTEMAVVIKGLTAFNASKSNGDTPNYLFIAVRSDDNNVVGGLIGATYLGWLQVQAVWISDELRGLGYGTKLMRAAEKEAVRRECLRVFLETLSFQLYHFMKNVGVRLSARFPIFRQVAADMP